MQAGAVCSVVKGNCKLIFKDSEINSNQVTWEEIDNLTIDHFVCHLIKILASKYTVIEIIFSKVVRKDYVYFYDYCDYFQ